MTDRVLRAMRHPLVTGNLHDAALRSQVSFQDDQTARGFERIRQRSHDFLSRRLIHAPRRLTDGLSSYGQRVGVKQARLKQSLGDELNPTRPVEIVCHEAPARLQVGEQWRARTDTVEVINLQLDPCLAGNSQQVQDRVGRAASRGHGRDGIFDRFAGKDLRRAKVAAQEFHD